MCSSLFLIVVYILIFTREDEKQNRGNIQLKKMDGAIRPPAPPFARGFDPSNQYSVVQLAQAASSQYVDLMEDLFHDADVSDSTASHRSPGISRKSPGTRTVRGREPPPTQILDFLFLGNVLDAKNSKFLRDHNIKTIINVSTEQYWLDDNTVEVHSFAALDTSTFEIRPLFARTNEILEDVRRRFYDEKDPSRKAKVLVHCQKGRSRSATIVLAYLIRSNGWTVHQALSFVVQRRDSVEPNIGFMEALREYQSSFTDDERRLLFARLCLHLRGVDPALTVNSIADFFEQQFGPVMDVKWSAPKAVSDISTQAVSDGTSQLAPEAALQAKGGSSNGLSEGDTHAAAETAINGDPSRTSSSKQVRTAARGGPLILVFFAGTEAVDAAHAAFKRNKKVFAPLASDLARLRIVPGRNAPCVSRALQRIAEVSRRAATEQLSSPGEATAEDDPRVD